MAFGVVAEDGVGVQDVVEFAEEWGVGVGDVVVVLPLEEADPDGETGNLVGVEVELDAEELARVGHGVDFELEVVLTAEDACLMPEVEEELESDVEEVAGAAGGVEDADGGEFGGPGLEDVLREAIWVRRTAR